jgi:hypothetical protein
MRRRSLLAGLLTGGGGAIIATPSVALNVALYSKFNGLDVVPDGYGNANITAPTDAKSDETQRLLIEQAVIACELTDLDIKAAMRRVEKGFWPQFIDENVSRDDSLEKLGVQLDIHGKTMLRTAGRPGNSAGWLSLEFIDMRVKRLDGLKRVVRTTADFNPGALSGVIAAAERGYGARLTRRGPIERRSGGTGVSGLSWDIAPPPGAAWPQGAIVRVGCSVEGPDPERGFGHFSMELECAL